MADAKKKIAKVTIIVEFDVDKAHSLSDISEQCCSALSDLVQYGVCTLAKLEIPASTIDLTKQI